MQMTDFLQSVLESNDETALFSLGQAGFIIKNIQGNLLAIDPYLSDCVERLEGHIGYKRLLPKILQPEDITFDALITTHEHWDHFDVDSIGSLMNNDVTVLFSSFGCRDLLAPYDFGERVHFIKPKDAAEIKGFNVRFVDCDHGEGSPSAVGVIIETDGVRIYEMGDTCLREDILDEIKTEYSPIDVLIAPINGAYGNLNEDECSIVSSILKPNLTIPCHYGMFASHGGNPGRFLECMEKRCPENKIHLMQMGEKLVLGQRTETRYGC